MHLTLDKKQTSYLKMLLSKQVLREMTCINNFMYKFMDPSISQIIYHN